MTAFSFAIVAAIGVLLLVPSVLLFCEVIASFLPGRAPRLSAFTPRTAVIVPAHNEESGIAETIASVLREMSPEDRVLVVADNCTDNTASVARAAGAEVIVREDTERRGKGFALDFALRHLAADPPDVVLIMDADCTAERGALRDLAVASHAAQRPLQADYRLIAPGDARTPYLLIAGFAWHLKNYIRPLGLQRLNLPCQLMGTGMAFPWAVLSEAQLATGDLVEDLALGLSLARAGHSPRFYPEARVYSAFPLNAEGQASQRTRWETGHLNTIVRHIPALLLEAARTGNGPLFALALDAAIPPLSFFALMTGAGVVLAAATAIATAWLAPFATAMLAATVFAGAIALAIWRAPDTIVSFRDLRLVPGYVFSKLSLYRQVAQGRPVAWVRSKRDTE